MKVRTANSNELDQIYMLAYDTWADGKSIEDYLQACRNSKKYRLGQWFVLIDNDIIRSAAIVYEAQFDLDHHYYGMGSIATDPNSRSEGYASSLISTICQTLESKGAKGLYLFSDIGKEFYEGLGFRIIQTGKSICMLRLLGGNSVAARKIPSYF